MSRSIPGRNDPILDRGFGYWRDESWGVCLGGDDPFENKERYCGTAINVAMVHRECKKKFGDKITRARDLANLSKRKTLLLNLASCGLCCGIRCQQKVSARHLSKYSDMRILSQPASVVSPVCIWGYAEVDPLLRNAGNWVGLNRDDEILINEELLTNRLTEILGRISLSAMIGAYNRMKYIWDISQGIGRVHAVARGWCPGTEHMLLRPPRRHFPTVLQGAGSFRKQGSNR